MVQVRKTYGGKTLILKKVLGKPGCGKTTFIANEIVKLIDNGVKLDDILFTTYSRSASRAIYDKLEEENIDKNQLKNFGTVYSLAHKTLGFSRSNFILGEDYAFFSRMKNLHYDYVGVKSLDDVDASGKSPLARGKGTSNILFAWFQLLKCIYVDNKSVVEEIRNLSMLSTDETEILDKSNLDIDYIVSFFKEWETLKKSLNKWEYDDYLQLVFLQKLPYRLPVKYIFLDETHDFGRLQMEVMKLWWDAPSVRQVIVCYDPMQTIFRFTGSNPLLVENLPAEQQILQKSYRVPDKPWKFATHLAESIGDNSMEGIESSGKEGSVTVISDFSEFFNSGIMNNGNTTFLLARTNAQVQEIVDKCGQRKIPVEGIGRTRTVWNRPAWNRPCKFRYIYNLFVKLSQDTNPTKEEAKAFISELPVGGILKRGIKKQFVINPNTLWSKSDDKISLFYSMFERATDVYDLKQIINTCKFTHIKKQYLRNITAQDSLVNKVTCFAGTLHSSKGLQADNVVIQDYFPRPDSSKIDETKLVYVGVTRTIDNCFIVKHPEYSHGFIEKKYKNS